MRIPGNFDRWMFNYKEGNLSAEEAAYFESFMLSNPNFAEDVEAWDNSFIRHESVEYPNMNALLKEKSIFAKWKNWAAALLLLLTVGGGISLSNQFLNKKVKNYTQRSGDSILHASIFPYQSNNAHTLDDQISLVDAVANKNTQDISLLSLIGNTESSLSQNSGDQLNGKKISSTDNLIDESSQYPTENFTYKNLNRSRNSQSSSKKRSRQIALSKIKSTSSDYSASYEFNPEFNNIPLDLSFKKRESGLLAFKLKRFFNKLDKITGYPIAIVNLRDPDLLIPNKNVLNFNPGFAGSGGNFRIGADYRNQWTSESVNSQVSTLYFDTYSKGARGGIGASVTYSDYRGGVYQNMFANLYYSPKFVIGKHIVFEPALKVTMGRLSSSSKANEGIEAVEFNRGTVITKDQGLPINGNNSWFKDYGVGFVLNTDWFYAGAFVDNLSGHDQRIYTPKASNYIESPKLITGVVGFDFQSRNKRTTLSPSLMYYQFGAKKELWAGATAQFNWLTIGASYSSNSEYAASVGLKFKVFKLIYQVDMVESEFLLESFVSHNIGIRFNTKNKTIR
ncbi:MAG: PorP/SprF family type IX secretion system membrane protein [Crocinitomicaceae bacterium]